MNERDDPHDLPAAIDFGRIPVNRHFGFSLLSLSRGAAEIAMPLEHHFLQEVGIVHGGVLSTLADTAAVYTVYPFLGEAETMAGIEFKMNFLRAVSIDDGTVTARAEIVRRGQRVAVVQVDLFQARRLVARGSFSYLVYRRGGDGV